MEKIKQGPKGKANGTWVSRVSKNPPEHGKGKGIKNGRHNSTRHAR